VAYYLYIALKSGEQRVLPFGEDEAAARAALSNAQKQLSESRSNVAIEGHIVIASTEIVSIQLGEAL
jgi:hypothetical protein